MVHILLGLFSLSSFVTICTLGFLFHMFLLNSTYWLCCESNPLVLSRFFSYATDLGLFLETGKGLNCVVFTESVDLRLDWWLLHYILESSAELLLGAKKDGFCLSTRQRLCVRSEVELYSLCQTGESEVVQPSFRFIKPCFCFRVKSSVLAGKQAGSIFKLKMEWNL